MQLNGGVCNTHLFQQHPSEQQQLLPYLFVDSGHFPPLSFGPIRSFETLGTKFWERTRQFFMYYWEVPALSHHVKTYLNEIFSSKKNTVQNLKYTP